ncbi:MAG: transcriptional repressor [Verrucomicrobia bacterium]|nr:transcriptional repressor [Verrucomicrobiota bacterium]
MSRTHAHGASTLPTLSADTILDLLRGQGMRITRGRVAIISALLAAKAPLSLEEIRVAAGKRARQEPLDFATVYRVMETLEELKIVQKIHLGRARSHYELVDPHAHHDHLVCTDCGKVEMLDEPCPVEPLERKLRRHYGYAEVKHSLEFFGRCPDCQ